MSDACDVCPSCVSCNVLTWKMCAVCSLRVFHHLSTHASLPTESRSEQSSVDAGHIITMPTSPTSTNATCSSTKSSIGTTQSTPRRSAKTSSAVPPSDACVCVTLSACTPSCRSLLLACIFFSVSFFLLSLVRRDGQTRNFNQICVC